MTKPVIKTLVCAAALLAAALLLAEAPPASTAGVNLTATTANVAGAPDAVRFEILRWSTDEERDHLMAAWEMKTTPASGGGAAKAGAGKGAAKGGKGAAKGAGPASAGAVANTISPEASLAKALQEATTVGYLWSSELAGYALRYAGRITNADGSQRIILITQRRLGAVNQLWKPSGDGAVNADEFSVIELRLNAKSEGEGRVSLTGKVAPDAAGKIVAPANYDALPAVFRNVRLQVEKR